MFMSRRPNASVWHRVIALAVGLASAASVAAALPSQSLVAEVGTQAIRIGTGTTTVGADLDIGVVANIGDLDPAVSQTFAAAARSAGAAVTTGRDAALGILTLTRAGRVVHAAPAGYQIPSAVTAYPRDALTAIYDRAAVDQLINSASPAVILNQLTADLMGAQPADVLTVRTTAGAQVNLVIAAVLSDRQIGGTELLTETSVFELLSDQRDDRAVAYGITDRAAFVAATAPLATRADTLLAMSWSPRNPDRPLTTAQLKAEIGEMPYVPTGPTTVAIEPGWLAANIVRPTVFNPQIPIRSRCNVAIVEGLRGALADIAAAGLVHQIDLADTNTDGGCYNPRLSRISQYLSRHAYAVAIDINTAANCQGCKPVMNCDVVRIFRAHGFAWGGNFRRPDGMHFEWVGERVDGFIYPSRYCPNIAPTSTSTNTSTSIVSTSAGPTATESGRTASAQTTTEGLAVLNELNASSSLDVGADIHP